MTNSNGASKSASFKYDFSGLSKNRMKTYARVVEEFERSQGAYELEDSDLDMLAAAGVDHEEQPHRDPAQ